ncbi:MAG: ABC transporter permease [bacterium]|nr:ABC transporter permease [bacterium]
MFSLDNWQEILDTLAKNKLRTLLTGFSVAWGIFMLIILLGSGNGLANGVEYQFRDDAINSLWIRSGQTSMPHQGHRPGRMVQFTNEDHDLIAAAVDGVEHTTGRYYVRSPTVTYGKESGNYDVRAVHPGHLYVENTIMTEGRYINELDVQQVRKTTVIGDLVKQALFKGEPAIGELIEINGVAFKVVGVFEDAGGQNEMEKIYLPISTAQRTYGGANRLAQMMVTTGDADLAESEAIMDDIRRRIAARHNFAEDDERAMSIFSNLKNFQRFLNLMGGIRLFVWIIGIGTILAGVVGVSNIMMIAVQERTKEIGIRKALGATPRSIIGLVLQESVLITGVAGYIGLVLGVGLLELAAEKMPHSEFFLNPSVDLKVAIYATLLLVLAGAVAGGFPARRAARIRPIEALRDE